MEAGTIVALGAMLISLFLAVLKYVDRRKAVSKEKRDNDKRNYNMDVERESFVVRGAEGAFLLMEKTLKTANEECEKRINELEEENEAQRCEIAELREENKELKLEIREVGRELADMRVQIRELTRRVDNG
jgi:septal ring factor EnvC (AmiA/AmiB activator)